MSNTLKDDPHWVKAADPARREKKPRHNQYRHSRGECDFDENDPRGGNYCGYWVNTDGVRYRWTLAPSKEHRRLEYWASHRNAVRGQLHRALTDDDLFDEGGLDFRNHRHHTASGGYWD